MFKIIWITTFVVVLTSCGGLRRLLRTDTLYKKDLKIYIEYWNGKKFINKQKFYGFALAKKASKYKITVFAKGDVDALVVNSCHREWTKENPKQHWWNKGVSFEYVPVNGLETNRNCPLDIGIYEQTRGRHGWGLIEFKDDRMTLEARVKCSGRDQVYSGVSICQSKYGLIQEISFKEDVDFSPIIGCDIEKSTNNKIFKYLMSSGNCTIHFCSMRDSKKCHRLSTFGYESVVIRESK